MTPRDSAPFEVRTKGFKLLSCLHYLAAGQAHQMAPEE